MIWHNKYSDVTPGFLHKIVILSSESQFAQLGLKKLIKCFSGTVLQKMMRKSNFNFFIFRILLLKNKMYLSNFQRFPTFSKGSNQFLHQKSTNQPKTNKMASTGGQIKLTTQGSHYIFGPSVCTPLAGFKRQLNDFKKVL